MLAEKPDLKFIPAQNIAHDEVIRAIVANRRGAARKRTALPDDDLMRVQQARKLHRHFFSATGRALDFSRFRYVGCHGDAHAAEKLNAFRDGIHKFHLLGEMLVEQQVKLIKRGTAHLPVRLLVEIPKRHRIRQQLIELFRHLQSDWFFEFQRKQKIYRAVLLDCRRSLVKSWLGAHLAAHAGKIRLFHKILLWVASPKTQRCETRYRSDGHSTR